MLSIKPKYLIDENGKRTAVKLSVEQWEDISDVLLSRSRENEPRISWSKLKSEMSSKSKLNGKI